jgi:KipI family sensor histidine kinase inhibitor
LVETADVHGAHALAAAVDHAVAAGDAPDGVEEVVVGFASVLVVLGAGSGGTGVDPVTEWLDTVMSDAGRSGARAEPGGDTDRPSRTHRVPVVFDGPDLTEVATTVGAPVERVVEWLVASELEVAFVGFAPGFPYLTGLPSALAGLPRRPTPRASVPAGAVAVAAGFASVYPRSTPGGWHLLGRTGEVLFDPDHPPHSRVAPGDRVRFTVATDRDLAPRVDAGRPLLDAGGGPCVEVLEAGLATTVQDAGRRGVAHLGVPTGGAADGRTAASVHLLLGDEPDTAAAIECTATGPTLRMVGDGHVAVVGAAPGAVDVTVDGRAAPDGAVLPVGDGQVVRVGRIVTGLRAYLGVAGGITTPVQFGSRSSDTLSGLGPGALRVGDRLARGAPAGIRGHLHPVRGPRGGPVVLRVVAGPHGPAGGLTGSAWVVGTDADRIGVRLSPLDGPGVASGPPRASTPMVTGAVQVPPDGRPIVLLPDHATVGGYPVVACVASVDLPLLGQLVPGDEVAFVEIGLADAVELARRDRRATAARVTGWFPTAAGT